MSLMIKLKTSPLFWKFNNANVINVQHYFSTWAVATILVSAFLLFEVQPIISKIILPWFGGSPMVWSTCLLFFQSLLLVGYAYTHILIKQTVPIQVACHLCLLIFTLAFLPIIPENQWRPTDVSIPTFYILKLLTVHVGLPYILLSSTAPLVQAWYSQVYDNRSPYRLYAVSNVSSMVALLSYPFIIEPAIDTSTQGMYWSLAFFGFTCIVGCLCYQRLIIYNSSPQKKKSEQRPEIKGNVTGQGLSDNPKVLQYAAWLLLPALASTMLMAITNHISQDIAAIPFLWVLPLSLYLLSFIICFDSSRWYNRTVFSCLTSISLLLISLFHIKKINFFDLVQIKIKLTELSYNIAFEASLYFSTLFFICMLCHGELINLKPPAKYLTSFYLSISTGGAIGGVFVALICPIVFTSYVEINIGLTLAYALSLYILILQATRVKTKHKKLAYFITVFFFTISAFIIYQGQFNNVRPKPIYETRNFYGGLRVVEFDRRLPSRHRKVLLHGRIKHGLQLLQPEKQQTPTTYFTADSGLGVAMKYYDYQGPQHVGIMGLGAGTVATYGQKGDRYRFYELDPDVLNIATHYFSFLKKSKADVNVVLGDARLSMESESPQNFDIIVMDAFTGDAPPVHLLTVEAFDVYLKHLKPNGILALNISNRHIDMGPLIAKIGNLNNMKGVEIVNSGTNNIYESSSTWVLLTRDRQFINHPAVIKAGKKGRTVFKDIRVWTDQYSNLFELLY